MESDFLSTQYVKRASRHLSINALLDSVSASYRRLSNHICCPHYPIFDNGSTIKYHHQSYCIQNRLRASTIFLRLSNPPRWHGKLIESLTKIDTVD